MLVSNLNVPFFLDNTLDKNFKVFGQILYVYFDPTFRRYVSVVDVGLKQKATIFVDEIFRYRKNFLGNNFQFLFLKRKDTFFLKPVHFLNSKNERVLKKRYLSVQDKSFSFLKLNSFSTLTLKYFNVKVENEFNFRNEKLLSLISLKSFHLNRFAKSYKFYALMFLNLLKDLKTSKHKIYKILQTIFLLNFLSLSILNIYKSALYLFYIQNKVNLSYFFSWFRSYKQNIIKIFVYNFSDLKLKKLFVNEPNNFFNFKSEKRLLKFFIPFKSKKSKKIRNFKKLKKNLSYSFKTNNRIYSRGLNENSNLLNLSRLNLERFNRLEFSFKANDKFLTTRFNFLNSNLDNKITALNRKLRTKNYFSIFSKGKAFALVHRLSFLNSFSYGAFMRRRIFRNWLKFIMYFEKLNYLIILNNEEVSVDRKNIFLFFYSLYFPIIFNFRNLFFNLLKFFRFFKSINEKQVFKNLGSWVYKDKVFNKRFFGILLNFLLLSSKKFNKIPKNLLLNTLSLYNKANFKTTNISKFNNLNTIKYLFLNIINIFFDKINYLVVNLNPNEKFINASLFKLAFINFSLGFNSSFFIKGQLDPNPIIQNSKDYLKTEWTPVFKIFKSLKITSKYAKKYRRRPNFSKRKKFKPIFRKRGQFLVSLGKSFKLQRLFAYPFKSRSLNTQKWSYVVNKIRVSPMVARYGAYLSRLNTLSNKFKSKVRLFPLKVFKNRLSLNFDKFKQNSSSNIYYQRIFNRILPKSSKIIRSLRVLKKDRFVRKWDKNQFYANPVNKNFRYRANKNFKNNDFSKRRFVSNKYQFKKKVFNSSKKPFYRQNFKKRFV